MPADEDKQAPRSHRHRGRSAASLDHRRPRAREMTGPPAADPNFVILTRTGSGWRIVVSHVSAALIVWREVL